MRMTCKMRKVVDCEEDLKQDEFDHLQVSNTVPRGFPLRAN